MIDGALLRRLLDGADDVARRELMSRAASIAPLVIHDDGTASFLGSTERMAMYEPSERQQNAEAVEDALGRTVPPSGVRCTPWQAQDRLQAVGVFVSLSDLAAQPWAERMHAYVWADAVERLDAHDPRALYPERPQWLPARDRLACAIAMHDEAPDDMAALDLFRRYHVEWLEPNQRAALTAAQPSTARMIARVAARRRARRH